VELKPKPEFKSVKMPYIGEAFVRPYQNAELILTNADYGKILCHCERVSLGELKDAVSSDIPATTLDALRRRTRAMQGRCQGFNCAASMNSILNDQWGRRVSEKLQAALPGTPSNHVQGREPKSADVLIVGAGPAGLAAALELKKLGIKDIVVAERESEAGGIPRMCGHIGFGLTDLYRVMTGPNYARKYRELADQAGIQIHTNTTITGWEGDCQVSFTSPDGPGSIEAKSVLLATGVRERPRAARLVPGYRPQGVYTTGSLQRFVYEHELPVGKRAVIVGAERVSLSVVMTLMHAGVKVLNMLTELPQHQLYLPVFLPAKILYADILARAPILTNTRVSNILGRQRVEGVEITDLNSGKSRIIECDTVVFTGDWIPENELVRRGDLETGKPSFGPQVDGLFRTSQEGVFAAGNLLRGVETADWAALEGRGAARSIARWLEDRQWSGSRLEVQAEEPINWICPNVLSSDVRVGGFRFRSNEFRRNVLLQLTQGGRVLYQKQISRLRANDSLNLSGAWAEKANFAGEPVKLVIQA
jgi:thioredoxin reductase